MTYEQREKMKAAVWEAARVGKLRNGAECEFTEDQGCVLWFASIAIGIKPLICASGRAVPHYAFIEPIIGDTMKFWAANDRLFRSGASQFEVARTFEKMLDELPLEDAV